MSSLPGGKSWILGAILLVFVALRAFGVANFAPHNDEVIYAEVASIIASDWEENIFIYQSGRHHMDYKEPLQHWANALTVNLARDPLLGCRVWSVLLGALGLIFLHRWVARVWSEPAAHVTAAMVAVSEYYFYFDSIAINEAFLYGLGAAFIFYTYDFFERSKWTSGALSLVLLLGLLLTKGSGIQWAVLAFILPVIVVARRPESEPLEIRSVTRSLGGMFLRLAVIVLTARWLHGVVIPAEYTAIRDRKLARGYVRSFDQLLEFPVQGWLKSASFYWEEVLSNEFSILLLPAIVLITAVAVQLHRSDKRRFACYMAIIALYFAYFVPLLLIAKVHFIRYFGAGLYFFYVALAIALVHTYERLSPSTRRIAACTVAGVVLGSKLILSWIPLTEWSQTHLSFRETPAGWANGSGIMELVAAVEDLEPGVVVTDFQWGHPTTALQIYAYRYPHIQLRKLTARWTAEPLKSARNVVKTPKPNVYFVFDGRSRGARRFIDRLVRNQELCGNRRVFEKRYKDEVMADSNLMICTPDL